MYARHGTLSIFVQMAISKMAASKTRFFLNIMENISPRPPKCIEVEYKNVLSGPFGVYSMPVSLLVFEIWHFDCLSQ